jgi:hypothetical protein
LFLLLIPVLSLRAAQHQRQLLGWPAMGDVVGVVAGALFVMVVVLVAHGYWLID